MTSPGGQVQFRPSLACAWRKHPTDSRSDSDKEIGWRKMPEKTQKRNSRERLEKRQKDRIPGLKSEECPWVL